MADAINEVFAASNLTPSAGSYRVVSAAFGDVIRVTPDRLLGTAALDVEVTFDTVKHLTAEVARLDKEAKSSQKEAKSYQKGLVALARGPLRIVSAQVLDMALGHTTLEQTHCTRVQSLSPDNPAIVKLAEMACKKPEELQVQLDKLITLRNNDGGHFTTLTALEDELEVVQDLLEMPEIKQRFKWEAWVVENYGAIKLAFPSQFQSKAQQA
ncbi:hypothetical protein GPECTOR_498g457 [Gonium pectorale]|uniref:Uncharacterized protein n=1 Tax=Gonium pectorale TaxID=33097 RepID=A0A150FUW5_GONPE|nr:hypothetical protein GPECTOR_498g457 [Gonium pectorale]|eukprot:KXZ41389.1 hypothetical protein GPECTOR_498g457 [Gonium pectorale]